MVAKITEKQMGNLDLSCYCRRESYDWPHMSLDYNQDEYKSPLNSGDELSPFDENTLEMSRRRFERLA